MFGRKRLADLERRLVAVVGLLEQHQGVHERMAGAIDELEKRQNNGLHATNAMIAGLTQQFRSLSVDTLAQLKAIATSTRQTAAAPVPEPQAQPTDAPQASVGAPHADHDAALAACDHRVIERAPLEGLPENVRACASCDALMELDDAELKRLVDGRPLPPMRRHPLSLSLPPTRQAHHARQLAADDHADGRSDPPSSYRPASYNGFVDEGQ